MGYDFDFLLEKIGGLGLSQIILAGAVFYFGFPSGFNSISPVFTSYSPDYRCAVPELDNCSDVINANFSYTVTKISTECDGSEDSCNSCERNPFNASDCSCDDFSCLDSYSGNPIPCDEYVYDRSLFTETAVTEFDLVCDRLILQAVATSMYMLGLLIGSFCFGHITDRIGRWPSMLITSISCFVFMLGAALSHVYWLYVFCRVMVSFFGYGVTIASFVYVMEIVGPEYRTLVGISFQMSFAIGYMTLSGFAYNWRDWHELQIAMLVASIPFGIFVLFLPESPRWLLVKGKLDKGKKITNWMGRMNKRPLTEEDWEESEKISNKINEKNVGEPEKKYSVKDLFRPGMRKVTYGVMFNWFVNSMVYYGITLNTGALSGDIFVNNVLSGLVEIIAYIVTILTMDKLGRKVLLSTMLLVAGGALLLCAILNEYSEGNEATQTTSKVFAFIGKMGISGSFAIIYNYTSELFPTVLRSNGVGIGSVAARVGGILAPFIIIIQYYVRWLPNVIFGIFSLIAAVFVVFLPETTGCDMLETIEQAELFYAGKLKTKIVPPQINYYELNNCKSETQMTKV